MAIEIGVRMLPIGVKLISMSCIKRDASHLVKEGKTLYCVVAVIIIIVVVHKTVVECRLIQRIEFRSATVGTQ
jgi:hypothetical protein